MGAPGLLLPLLNDGINKMWFRISWEVQYSDRDWDEVEMRTVSV